VLEDGYNGHFYIARGVFVGANGDEVAGYAVFHSDLDGRLGDLGIVLDVSARYIEQFPDGFEPVAFRPDKPLPSRPHDVEILR
jgi:hypothetical protein